jgi:hypothetical protein
MNVRWGTKLFPEPKFSLFLFLNISDDQNARYEWETVTIGPSEGGNYIATASLSLQINRTLLMTEFVCYKLIINCNSKSKVNTVW